MTPAQTRAEQRTAQRLAEKRVLLIPEDKRTHPPLVEDLWRLAWYCVFVTPFREQRVRSEAERAGFQVYLPVATYWNSARFRTKRQLERPLLVRYLFVGCGHRGQRQISDDDWTKLRGLDGVHEILGDAATGEPLAVPVENLVSFVGRQVAGEWDATSVTYAAGQTVTITKAPLKGFTGTVERAVHRDAAPDDPISIIVTMMGRQTVARIPLADFAAVE